MSARRYLDDKDKIWVLNRYRWKCPGVPAVGLICETVFQKISDAIYDHIGQRSVTKDDSRRNYQPLCVKCNDIKTNGPGGEKRITPAGSDAGNRAKVRAFRARQRERLIPRSDRQGSLRAPVLRTRRSGGAGTREAGSWASQPPSATA